MAVNVVDFINKIQEEGLTTLKQTQEASLAAMGDFRKFATELSDKPGTVPTFENLPTRPSSSSCRSASPASSSKSARPTR